MSYHYTYEMAKGKPKTIQTETSIKQHKCTCMMQTLCKCTCHQVPSHLSPEHSFEKVQDASLIKKSIDNTLTSKQSNDQELDLDYYQRMRKNSKSKHIRNQQSEEEFNTINQSYSPKKYKATGSQSTGCIFKQKEDNKKIQLDLETFNQELLALKQKLANEKKEGSKQCNRPPNNNNNINTHYANQNQQSYIKLYKESFFLTFRRNDDYLNNNDMNKDLIIDELKSKLYEMNDVLKLSQQQNEEKELKIEEQESEINSLRSEVLQLKNQISLLKKSKPNQTKRYIFDSHLIKPIKVSHLLFNGIAKVNGKKSGSKYNQYEESESIESKLVKIGETSNRLMKRIQFDNQKVIQSKKLKYSNNNKVQLSNSLIFKVYDNKSILCFDIEAKNFYLYHYADYGNFEENFAKEHSFSLTLNTIFYIVTGKNSDMLYSYHPKGSKMIKLCGLLNNHTKGRLISYVSDSNEETLICIGSSFNKKVEEYSIQKNNWSELPELNEEREDCSCLITNNMLYVIFGFNSVLNTYVEKIEYFDLKNKEASKWKYVALNTQDNINFHIKGSLSLNYNDQKIILIGGVEGVDSNPIKYFYQLIIEDTDHIVIEKTERKFNDINKNKCYSFSNGLTYYEDNKKRQYISTFDDKGVLHTIEIMQMIHDVYYFE